jgi:hypothetical protein
MEDFFNLLTQNKIIIFPYFAAAISVLILIAIRQTTVFARYGLQIAALAVVLPVALFATGKEWVSHDALTAVLSGIIGYVFGTGPRQSAGRQ